MNAEIRRTLKDLVRQRAQVVFAAVDGKGTTFVELRMRSNGMTYTSFGSAKWNKKDVFNTGTGARMAYEMAERDMVDQLIGYLPKGSALPHVNAGKFLRRSELVERQDADIYRELVDVGDDPYPHLWFGMGELGA